jgi:hypothetical protein
MKFCKDCIHYEKYNHLCQSPSNPVSRVTGKPTQQDPYKSRYDENLCGEQGVFWIPGQYVRS